MPHLYQTGFVAFFLITPIPMLYMKKVIRRNNLNKKDLLYFIPAILVALDLMPVFLKDSMEKEAAIINQMSDINQAFDFKLGFFLNNGHHYILVIVFILICLIPQINMLIDVYKIREDKFWNDNGGWVRWLTVYTLCQLMLILPPLLFYWLFPVVFWLNWYVIYIGTAAIVTASYLLTHPNMLYGIKGLIVDESSFNKSEEEQVQVEENKNFLSEDQNNTIRNKLEGFVTQHLPYLQKGYGLKDLSRDTGIPSRLISSYINQYEGISFYDYINKLRVEHIKKHVPEEDLRQLTLEAIAELVGFNNRTSFVNAVKKFTGKTPSEYVNEILRK
jgi:AraC-like DNA-binding protein